MLSRRLQSGNLHRGRHGWVIPDPHQTTATGPSSCAATTGGGAWEDSMSLLSPTTGAVKPPATGPSSARDESFGAGAR